MISRFTGFVAKRIATCARLHGRYFGIHQQLSNVPFSHSIVRYASDKIPKGFESFFQQKRPTNDDASKKESGSGKDDKSDQNEESNEKKSKDDEKSGK